MADAPVFETPLVREIALQMLYQWEMSSDDLDVVFDLYPRVMPIAATEVQLAAAMRLARATATQLADIDALVEAACADRIYTFMRPYLEALA